MFKECNSFSSFVYILGKKKGVSESARKMNMPASSTQMQPPVSVTCDSAQPHIQLPLTDPSNSTSATISMNKCSLQPSSDSSQQIAEVNIPISTHPSSLPSGSASTGQVASGRQDIGKHCQLGHSHGVCRVVFCIVVT